MDLSIPKYNLEWSTGKVFGKDIDRSIVKKKFAMYDYALHKNMIGIDYNATQLLNDDTIFAYAFLKWEGSPIMMRYYQDAIMSDPHKRIDVEAANQQGKSFSLCTKAASNFLRDHSKNFTIGLISKSMAQNGMNMRMVRKMLKESPIQYKSGGNDSMTVMTHDVGDGITNTLVCSVASTGALGYPFDLLLLDEFEFWENPEGLEYMYDQVLEPRTFHTKGQIIIYSNPNGKNFVSENLHKRMIKKQVNKNLSSLYNSKSMGGMTKTVEEFQFHVYNINFLDNPDNSREDWEVKKSMTHPIIFASTMAALRTESEGAALTEKDIHSCKSEYLDNLGFRGVSPDYSWWFLDLGFVYDQTVLASCFKTKNDNGEVVYNFPIKTYPISYDINKIYGFVDGEEESVPQIIKRHGKDGYVFELDLTGKEGNEVLANKAGLSCSGVKMSGPWKAKWYDRFITLVKQGRIKIQNIDNYLDGHNKNFNFQARSLRISTKMPDGRTRPYPIYHHSNERDHDDILDAIVGCLSLVDEDMDNFAGALWIDHNELIGEAQKIKREELKREIEEPYDEEIELAVDKNRKSMMYDYGFF